MSKRALTTTALFALILAGCGGGGAAVIRPQPAEVDETTTEGDAGADPVAEAPVDPNTANAMFLYEPSEQLTMDSVAYDAASDTLVINNLPFDGPDMTYDRRGEINGVPIYASRTSEINGVPTKGIMDYYAVFVANKDLQAFSAASSDWGDYGFAGAGLKRTAQAIPLGDSAINEGEYVYVGTYAATRTFDDKTGLEFVTGDARFALDVLDVDPVAGVQGTIAGDITNRQRRDLDGRTLSALPNVSLATLGFETETGRFTGGEATTRTARVARDSGSYQGMIAGADGGSIGALVNITGPAEMQEVSYEIVTYQWTEQRLIGVDPITLQPTYQPVIQTGVSNAMTDAARAQAQIATENGQSVGMLTVDRSLLPENAVVTSTRTESEVFRSDTTARELGVAVTEQLRP